MLEDATLLLVFQSGVESCEPSYLRSPHQIDGVGGGRRALIWHRCRGEPCCVIWGFMSSCQNAISCVWYSYPGNEARFGPVMVNSCHGEESGGDLHLFLFGDLSLILVAVYFERRHRCWSANVLEYSEDLQLRPVHTKQQRYIEVKVSADSLFK